MYADSGWDSNQITPATSAGSPMRPAGMRDRKYSILAVSVQSSRLMSVAIAPGRTALQVMPCGPSTIARLFISELIPAFVVQ